jgi:hypothetical protein
MRERGHDLHLSNINGVIKLGRVRWMENASRIEERERHTGFWVGKVNKIRHLEDLDLNGRVI